MTPREVEVLRLIADGRSNREIADEMVLSVRTVERHIKIIYDKVDSRGEADATAYALGHRLAQTRAQWSPPRSRLAIGRSATWFPPPLPEAPHCIEPASSNGSACSEGFKMRDFSEGLGVPCAVV